MEIASRGTDGVGPYVIRVHVREVLIIGEVSGVAGGYGQDHLHAVGGKEIESLLIGRREGPAFSVGTQRQVDSRAAEDQSIFYRGEVVGLVRSAYLAEHLHDDELCVRSHTYRISILRGVDVSAVSVRDVSVGGSYAGNVRTVVGLLVVLVSQIETRVRSVLIVVGVRDLCRDVYSLSVKIGCGDLLFCQKVGRGLMRCIVFSYGMQESALVERLVGVVDTGVDDSNELSRSGIALGPRLSCAYHVVGRIGGIRTGFNFLDLELLFDEHLLDAQDHLDGRDVLVLDVGGDDVHCQGKVPLNVESLAELFADLCRDSSLLGLEALSVSLGSLVLRIVLYRVTGIDGGLFVQNDRYTYDVVRRVFFGLFRCVGDVEIDLVAQFLNVKSTGIDVRYVGAACAV